MKEIDIFTDGACLGNPGPGGWAAILKFKDKQKEIFGGEINTTNNRMELTAIIEAFKMLNEPCKVNLYSDSKYVCDSISKGWAKSWKLNNWKKSNNKLALNIDLWEELLYFVEINEVEVCWIKGHAGQKENEKCDELAVKQAKKQIL
ncbi:MAG: ribonuclease HI [Oscillospiraceae bacterium]|nr:ribonuclease HI [Oscillospiraceae bacterium]